MKDMDQGLHASFFRFQKLNLSVLYPKLSNGEMILLKILREKCSQEGCENGVCISSLGEKMCMAPPAMSRMLNSLEERGLIVRTVNKADRRNMLVQMTDLGRQMDREADAAISQFMRKIQEQVGEERIRQVVETMNQMYEIAREELELRKKNKMV